ncbi:hypothetical protein [Tenacibaculum larymnensis]|uniref:Uncharacterized protein n=1 Tax=Tenacibaculum larymnensis TaxID=2878201 RepID=A0A9X4EP67_9FLAO|nr:hypothetical protein [Tenacibaculum larymnensis]MDE1206030.1 hypothetical protein [Tenacibaculum larymnensis]
MKKIALFLNTFFDLFGILVYKIMDLQKGIKKQFLKKQLYIVLIPFILILMLVFGEAFKKVFLVNNIFLILIWGVIEVLALLLILILLKILLEEIFPNYFTESKFKKQLSRLEDKHYPKTEREKEEEVNEFKDLFKEGLYEEFVDKINKTDLVNRNGKWKGAKYGIAVLYFKLKNNDYLINNFKNKKRFHNLTIEFFKHDRDVYSFFSKKEYIINSINDINEKQMLQSNAEKFYLNELGFIGDK